MAFKNYRGPLPVDVSQQLVQQGFPFEVMEDVVEGPFVGVTSPLTQAGPQSGILSVTKTFTNAKIKSLPTDSPVVIIATQSNIVIQPLLITLIADPWAAAYTNIDGSAAWVLGNSAGTTETAVIAPIATVLAFTTPKFTNSSLFYSYYSGDLSDWKGQGLYLKVSNGALGNFMSGDSTNVLTLIVYYSAVAVA